MTERDATLRAPARRDRRAHIARALSLTTLIVVAVAGGWEGWRLGVWSTGRPGPGLWPVVVSAALLIAVLEAFRKEHDHQAEPLPHTSWRRELFAFSSLAAYIVAFAYLGAIVPTAIFLLLWLRFLAREPWTLSIVLALAGTAGVYFMFSVLLGIPFPSGPLT
ncbi:tripartite tricarboxylate transporter TctB family protein [Qaidamihabitans albus]|uniref:tripartite tricarboxylate transporter TctB family protein n=1 Tax=Qaidamihabitans albus TaxID=2795733 RepID=UPI0018F25BA8|nr:tripartite tricarboxylate transporter TctB family protein [Qaidamihabitans albus]